jgi:undecaprenyl-phosphate 4-deoxy-4-formamido-L-arabinose transferase
MTAVLRPDPTADAVHEVSIVVPVYQGEQTIGALVDEIAPLTTPQRSPAGLAFQVSEVLLVHDGAIDRSASVIRSLAARAPFVRPIWLSRNFGQHAATLAGMASTVSPWVATIDEDGQQAPRDVGRLLDEAIAHGAQLVYARPLNAPPHGFVRNRMSAVAKWAFANVLGNRQLGAFDSFRLMQGEIARGVAAYCGPSVYLDVALSWVVAGARHCPVTLRRERGRPSGYSAGRLLGHFWQLVLTSGTRPLRVIALAGAVSVLVALGASAYVLWGKLHDEVPVQGWTSSVLALCLFGGLILLSLGIIAEYLGVAVSMAMGRPPYLIASQPPGEEGRPR